MYVALEKLTVMMPFRLSTLLTELRAHLTEKVAAVSIPDLTSGEDCHANDLAVLEAHWAMASPV